MKMLKNKYFILGNILLILLVIPITLFFISQNQENRSSAAPSTILSMDPAVVSAKRGTPFNIKVMVNPGQNLVSIVDMYLLYDATKLKLVSITPNKTAFQNTLRGPIIQNGSANISLNIGSDTTKSISVPTEVAVLNFEPLANTDTGPTKVSFDQAASRVFSLSAADGTGENVLQTTQPADVTISDTGGGTPTLTITPSITITGPVNSPTPTKPNIGQPLTPTPTTPIIASPSPTTVAVNNPPVCTGLSIDRALSGAAPYSLTFTANGNDPDNTISKVTFDFGDGPVQTLNSNGGIGTNVVSVSMSHTYNNPGTYNASVILTDGGGKSSAASVACQKTINVTQDSTSGGGGGGGGGNTGGGGNNGGGGGQPKPTLESPGGLTTTLGIIGGILFVIIGGAILLAL